MVVALWSKVILLVGLILLPSRFAIRGTGMYHHCRGEPIDVAQVLVFLSPDLASQIANRKAFYKETETMEAYDVESGQWWEDMRSDHLFYWVVWLDRLLLILKLS